MKGYITFRRKPSDGSNTGINHFFGNFNLGKIGELLLLPFEYLWCDTPLFPQSQVPLATCNARCYRIVQYGAVNEITVESPSAVSVCPLMIFYRQPCKTRMPKRVTKKTVKTAHRRPAKKTTRKSSPIAKNLFEAESSGEHRLQKILASAGFGSRRQCEELIEQGRVEISGTVAKLGSKVDPFRAIIKVDGERLKSAKPIYLALFKPKGYLCTDSDQQGRARVIELVPASFGRLFLVGRLDKDSEGLILLTNDGALSERLTHPRYGVPKIYRVQVAGELTEEGVRQLREGVHFAEGFAKAEHVVIKGRHKQSTILDITLTEGMNREIRRLLARIGHKVLTLIRIAVGPVKLGKMAPGEWRKLTQTEVERLYTAGAVHNHRKPKK